MEIDSEISKGDDNVSGDVTAKRLKLVRTTLRLNRKKLGSGIKASGPRLTTLKQHQGNIQTLDQIEDIPVNKSSTDNEEKENNYGEQHNSLSPNIKPLFPERFDDKLTDPVPDFQHTRVPSVIDMDSGPLTPQSSESGDGDKLLNGDLVWAFIPGYPLWPSIITVSEEERVHTKTKRKNFSF